MNSKSNRNIFLVAGAAIAVAAVTAGALFAFNGGEDKAEGTNGSTSGTAVRRLMTPASLDTDKNREAKDNVVAAIARSGRGQVIVEVATNLSPNASAQDRVAAIASAQDNVVATTAGSVNVVAKTERLPIMLLDVDEAAARSLASSVSVVSMMENTAETASVDDTIPLIGALDVYSQGYTGNGWSVAVLDTPQDTSHHFFADRVLQEACFSFNGEGKYSLCPNGEDEQVGPGAAANCQVDWCDHGTHVVGIAAGNGSGGSGVAKDAGIISVNVFSDLAECSGQENCIRTWVYDQIAALEWVLANKDEYRIAAVNMSLGGGQYFDQGSCDAANGPRKAAIDALLAANVAVVAAAGNESFVDSLGAPGCISSAIGVGSTTKSDGISDFSNSDETLDILAPGGSIVSAAPGGGWASLSGTSMASPHVAGSFALLRSAAPEASVQDIFNALDQSGVGITDPRNGIVRSRIQVDGALTVLKGGAVQPTPSPRPQPQPNPTSAPENDDEANAVQINSANFRHTVDTRNATLYDDPAIRPTYYCPEGGHFDKTVWYEFTAPSNGYLTISTQGSSYDTIMSVWQGSRGYAWMVGCNDDDDYYGGVYTSTIGGWVAKGTSFRIQVAAWDNGGSLVFSAAFQPSNVSSVVTNSEIAPVVLDARLTEAPSDLAGSRANSEPARPASCGTRPARPADLQGECFRGPAPR